MSKYLLACDCGEKHLVEPGQAGERLTCRCGATLDVPPLRKMRHLPSAVEESRPPTSTWNTRKGFVAACLLIALVAAFMAAWSWYTEPRVAQFDSDAYRLSVDKGLETMTPEQSWRWWVEVYRPLADEGMRKFEDAHASQIEAIAARHRFLQMVLLAAAAVLAVIAGVIAFWPTPVRWKRGAGERGRHR